MRYRLRTLLILLAIAPPIVALVGIAVFNLNPEPISVSGRVVYRGMPASPASVEFVPESNPGGGPRYVAKTDAQGRFKLPADGGPSLKAGRYDVTIAVPGAGTPLHVGLVVDLRPESNQLDFDLQ